ncbi:iron chelate uptake ABC transporter family permease subunit, partial [Candidatus Bathyarchaeota archaeon]|nr:iron chelate uptake ABC transporter family permease subunit [Candidatus Bathyarchaeota archaeon]
MKIDAGESHLRRVSHWKLYFVLLTCVLLLVFVFSLNIGFSNIPFENILKILGKNIPILGNLVETSGIADFGIQESIIIHLRLPRVLGGALVGVALAVAGVAYQGIFRNPMADPYTIGAMGGASFGAAIAIVLGVGVALLGVNTVPIFAFIGAVLAVFLVYAISREGSRVPVTTLILSGLTVTIFFNALVTYLKLIAGDKLHALTFWIMGGFTYTNWTDVSTVFPLVIIASVIIYLYARDLNILVLGEEQAQHLGVELEKVKKILLAAGALMTAAAVSISGLIGFVGLIIPHLTRILIGPDHRILLPTSAIVGASFMMICDALARVIIAPSELPV